MADHTTISVSKEFRNALHSEKKPGESYEDLLKEMLDGDREVELPNND